MKQKLFFRLLFGILSVFPVFAFAQPTTIRDFGDLVVQLVKGLVAILFASLAVGLVYGVVQYFLNADNEKKRTEIKGFLIWGVVGIIVAYGLWGILQILSDTFGPGAVGIPLLSPPV